MKPWSPEWRAWLYALAWLFGGVVLTLMSMWLVTLIVDGAWGKGTETQRIGIIGIALYMTLSGPLLVMIGLGLRNAIRNLKGTIGGATFEANGRDDTPAATVTTTTQTEVSQ